MKRNAPFVVVLFSENCPNQVVEVFFSKLNRQTHHIYTQLFMYIFASTYPCDLFVYLKKERKKEREKRSKSQPLSSVFVVVPNCRTLKAVYHSA